MKNRFLNLSNLLVFLSVLMALIFVYSTYGTYWNFSNEQKNMTAFYVTNAGINQAVWYLANPPAMGGYGPKWRVKNLKKYFSVGSYVISVADGHAPGEIIITSRGEAEGVDMMLETTVVYAKSLPDTFNYSLYSGSELTLSGNSKIIGNIYVNDNLKLTDAVAILGGRAFTTPGYDIGVEGSPVFSGGSAHKPYPVFPVLDTSFYYEKIVEAKSRDPGVIQGDVSYRNIDVANRTVYVNGNVSIKGDIKGAGTIVCTRNMNVSDSKIGDGVLLIANGKMRVSGDNTVPGGNAILYSKQKLSIDDGSTVRGSAVILSPTVIEIGKKASVCGLIYAPMIVLGAGSTIDGSIVAENFGSDGGLTNVTLKYDVSLLPLTVMGFNVGSEVIMTKPGSMKKL